MTEPTTLARNANVADLVAILRTNQARKLDVVVPASKIRSSNGDLVLTGTDSVLSEDGVTVVDGVYRPTAICDGGIASKLDIPPSYLGRLRRERPDMYDTNVNGWLHGWDRAVEVDGAIQYRPATPDPRKFLVRCFRADDGGMGVARALLSDSYKPIEDLDVLMTALEGIKDAGVPVQIAAADLTDRRMYVRVVSEQVQALAPTLLRNYRSPFTGQLGVDYPMVFGGFELSNSEVGHGAFQIAPRIVFQVCKNGATIKSAAIREQHLGTKLDEGAIAWSEATRTKSLELVRSMTADAIRSFLSQEWLEAQIAKMERVASAEVAKPEETIKIVAEKLRYTQAQQDDILAMFIRGGDITAGGVMQAVTASAQNQTDADRAADMESDAERVLELAYTYRNGR